MFANCKNLRSVTISDGIASLGDGMFLDCGYLEISLPTSLTDISISTFIGCNIEKISVASGNTAYKVDGDCLIKIDGNVLVRGTNNSVIPDYVEEIGYFAFMQPLDYDDDFDSIKTIRIPANIKIIGPLAFRGCKDLETVYIGCNYSDTLLENAREAFNGCDKLTEIYVKAGDVEAFKNSENWSKYAHLIKAMP